MTEISSAGFDASASRPEESGLSVGDLAAALLSQWKLLVTGPLLAGGIALGYSYTLPPVFTATTTILPPQQTQSGTASALASLGSLAGLAAGAAGLRTPGDQYVALMQSVTVADHVIDQFKLTEAYGTKRRSATRELLSRNVRVGLGKKDGLITVEVDDTDPQRAADIANRFVFELRRMTSAMTLTEVQRRRAFFEGLLSQSRDKLAKAQLALQSSGFNADAIKADPKATAEGYARLQAQVAAAEVQLQSLRGSLTDSTAEVQRQQATLAALRDQLSRTEQAANRSSNGDFVSRYREFKYQETLFELYARQFELARADEGRESDSIQVVDPATAPEIKSRPKRLQIALVAAAIAAALLSVVTLFRRSMR